MVDLAKKDLELRLYPIDESDVEEDYYRGLTDPEVTKYLECKYYPQTIDSIKKYVRDMNENRDVLFMKIKVGSREYKTSYYVGNIKIGPINWVHRFADVGLVIWKEYWGSGYGSEAIKMVTNHCLYTMNLHLLWAGCLKENEGSIKAFKKAGWEEVGVMPNMYWLEDHYTDDVILQVRRD